MSTDEQIAKLIAENALMRATIEIHNTTLRDVAETLAAHNHLLENLIRDKEMNR